jgi:outer membrane protein OmpA-like peptidoglycan-associated protein
MHGGHAHRIERVMRRRVLEAVRAVACCSATVLALAGCAKNKTSTACPPDQWSGECLLVSLTKVEDREHPIPHVVYEARYRPEPNASAPHYAPQETVRKFWIASQYELDLRDHLEAHRRVACGLPVVPAGSCADERVVVNVPEFDVALAERRHREPEITGCARIEAASEQDRLALGQRTRHKIPETLMFEAHSAALSPEARSAVAAIAERLKTTPDIECVGVVGQTTTGEPPTLAAERARNVRDLLVALGVAEQRLMTVIATTSVFGAGAKPADPDPTQRKVGLSVLLERAQPAASTP